MLLLFLNFYQDFSVSIGELHCVRNQIQKDLLHSLDVCCYLKLVLESNEALANIYCFELDFVLQDVHYFIYGFSNIELFWVFNEVFLVLVENGII